MNEIGLSAAISEWLEDHIGKRHYLKTAFIEHIADDRYMTLDADARAMLFRNVRELLANVVKHARADSVRVCLTCDAAGVVIVVEDDGAGFDPADVDMKMREDGGFGLFSIHERMADLGGTFEIQSAPGRGARATLTLPAAPLEDTE
jgi:signal transduction histidine kinase